ncbi:hypothetical protein SIO70_14645 [Chitinophaga sancti]|uniref:hypothetical protein n=1 Tax=Chitinophaga sancti TaxID=1004 RepID=UPI002A74DD34|nr:hypothetical protein [Chitinophaga sancti]WPQ66098.1 hypothetical protein SIO70_14645 [Chitinophaga sancti]
MGSIEFYYELSYNAVFVIQSLKIGDRETGDELYNNVIKWKCLKNNTAAYLIIIKTKEDLFNFFQEVKILVMRGMLIPILHFEMHSSEQGIQLTSMEVVTWEDLGLWCRELNVLIKNQLVISIATCMGVYFYKAIDILKPAPYWGYIGPKDKISGFYLLRDFTNFYDIFLESGNLEGSITSLNNESTRFEYLFMNGDVLFTLLYEQLDKIPYNKESKFHKLKGFTKKQFPLLNRAQRRSQLKKNIEEHDPIAFKKKVKDHYLMKD